MHLSSIYCDFGPPHVFWCFSYECSNRVIVTTPQLRKCSEDLCIIITLKEHYASLKVPLVRIKALLTENQFLALHGCTNSVEKPTAGDQIREHLYQTSSFHKMFRHRDRLPPQVGYPRHWCNYIIFTKVKSFKILLLFTNSS